MGRSNRGSSRRTPIVYKSAPLVASARRESSGFLANVYGGLTSGLGFGMAQRLVEGIFGPRQIETIHQDTTVASRNGDKCEFYANELQQCTLNNRDISLCQPLVESLRMCRNNQTL